MHELHSDPLSPLILKSFFLYLLIISRLTHTSNGMDQLENSCIDQYVGSSNKEVGISTSYIGKDGRHQAMENINISDGCRAIWMEIKFPAAAAANGMSCYSENPIQHHDYVLG